mmetsp:Transcript_70907/g.154041  ORF Transcript_70907/g.154041 Transcript_70907/m.154041 type:complete len:192 (+) Transcript_70907:33-608(+)
MASGVRLGDYGESLAVRSRGGNEHLRPRGMDGLPLTAGLALSSPNSRGLLSSPLHPETHQAFHFTRKRQAYGSVAPHNVPPIRHQPLRSDVEYEDEARKSWFKSYAADSERRAFSMKAAQGTPRSLGASGPIGHAEGTDNWQWQSWRGWTSTQRHNHEQRMRQVWMDEARERWRQSTPREEKLPIMDVDPR